MKLWRTRQRSEPKGFVFEIGALNQYVDNADVAANAVDLVPGWNHRLPLEGRDLGGGAGALYEDARILWAIEQAGGVAGRSVLEIGPLEAAHTYMLARAGATVTAVEANKLAFVKCLIAKELCGIEARFHLAEINRWLDATDARFDLVVACGVLYHMREPIEFIERIARRTDALYLWTHYVDERLLTETNVVATDRPGPPLVPHSYSGAAEDPSFCGGVFDLPRWMTLAGIVETLGRFGFDSIETAHGTAEAAVPSISIFARRSAAPS